MNHLLRAGTLLLAVGVFSGCMSIFPGDGGQWYKGNTHTHTVLCGHADSPPEFVAQWYLDRDYNFLILSEHNQFIDPATVKLPEDRRQDFILVPGVEVTGHRHVHSTAMNVDRVVPWVFRGPNASVVIQNQVNETNRAGGHTILNHPNFRKAIKAADMLGVDGLYMFELYNGHPSVDNDGQQSGVATEDMWDEMLTAGMLIYGVSSDDAHHFQTIAPNKSNPGRGWVMVQAAELSADALTAAMVAGNFYASNGVSLKTCEKTTRKYLVEVDVARTEQTLTEPKLRGKKVSEGTEGFRIDFIGPGGKVLQSVADTTGAFELDASLAYVRAKVTFTRPHPGAGFEEYYAWGQPAFTDQRAEKPHLHAAH